MDHPWIKLWVEMLSDPKIARLPDWLWRRWVEFLMLAGYNDANGKLPPVEEMGWMLHLAPEKVEDALQQLSLKVGVVRQETDGSWIVAKFEKRQASPSKERTERWREREKKRHGDGHGDTTDSSSSSSSDSDSSSDSLKEVIRVYESEIGALTKTICEDLEIAVDKYPADWITAALGEAARNNKRSWSYANAILKRWQVDGFQSVRKAAGGSNGNGASTAAEIAAKYPKFRAEEAA